MKITPLGVTWLALACLLGIVEQWLPQPGPGLWRYAAAGLLLALLYEWLLVRRNPVRLEIAEPERLQLGHEAAVSFALVNTTRRLQRLELAPGLPEALTARSGVEAFALAPGETREVTWRLNSHDLGRWRWSRLPARLRGALGIALWTLRLQPDVTFNVVPHRRERHYDLSSNLVIGDRAVTVGAGMELHHLRDYQRGDPLRAVNWKASARTGRMISTVFSEEQHLEVILLLDVGRTSRTRVDGMSQCAHYINVASEFAGLAIASGDYVGLLAAADTAGLVVAPARGQKGLLAIDRALLRLAPTPGEVDLRAAALRVQSLARNRALVLFFTDLYGQDFSGAFGRSLALLTRRHMVCVVGLVGEDVTSLGERREVDAAGAYASLAAAEYIDSIRANTEALKRLGASAVLAGPRACSRRVMREYRTLKAQRRI